jgi:hypothetical protein
MNGLIMCSAVALNIFSAPAGNTVVGVVPAYQRVFLMDGSLLRDWVFIGKPGPDGVSPRGWVIYRPRTVSVMATDPLCDVRS